jgi:hypothetical protein
VDDCSGVGDRPAVLEEESLRTSSRRCEGMYRGEEEEEERRLRDSVLLERRVVVVDGGGKEGEGW